MVRLNAVIERAGLATTSPLPRYSLQAQFADLFNPKLQGEELDLAIQKWQEDFLSATSLARVALSKRLVSASSDGVLVNLPNGETRKMLQAQVVNLQRQLLSSLLKNS